jgi:hypothetical protein
MDVESLAKELILKNMTSEQQMAVLNSVRQSVVQAKEVQKRKIGENVDLVVQALKKIDSDLRSRFEDVGNAIEKRVASIKDGRDGINGKNGRDGKDGKSGKDGATGPAGRDGVPGRDGVDGDNGTGVASARIDFDGSLVIVLDNGREINVGEVVPFDVAERIKVISNGGGTSQYVLDTLASLQAQISAISGGLSYQGTWNASTNTPTLTSSSGTSNYYYVVSVSGSTNLNGITDWVAGDWAIYNGTVWQKIDQTNLVISVAGRTGAITLTTADIGGLGTIATQAANNVSITGGSITGITALTATGNAIISDNSANAALRITQIGAGNALLVEDSANPDSTPFVVDASGGVVIGNTSALTVTDFVGTSRVPRFQQTGTGGSVSQAYISSWSTSNTSTAGIIFGKSNSGTVGTAGVVESGTDLGFIQFSGDDGTNMIRAALILAEVDGTPGTNDMPGRLVFSTTADGASSPTERLRIASTGAFGLAGANYGTSGQVLTSGGTSATPTWTTPTTGTVTSVTGTSPVASSGGATPAISLSAGYGDTQNPYASKTANFVLAAPNGSAGAPTFRAIVAADIPTLNQNTTGSASNVTGTVAIGNGGTGKTSEPAAMANLMGFTSTVTAAGTTTLDNTSSYYQLFTGTTTQTVVLPVTSTLQKGWTFHICNNSTGALTVNSSGGNLLISVIAGTTVMCTCIDTTTTTAADWEAGYTDFSAATGTGAVVLGTSPTIASATLTAPTATGVLTFSGTAASASNFHTTQTSGVMTIGGTAGTGNIIVGRSTVSQTTSIQAGATASGSTKTINFGSGGLAGSTTAITIGSTAGTSTTTLNGTTTLANALAVTSGGTGATTTSGARTNLGLVIGTDVLAPNGSAASLTSFPTFNQNTTGTAASTPKLLTTNFTIEESGGKLLFKYGATTIASMSSTGVITSVTNIVANGTP